MKHIFLFSIIILFLLGCNKTASEFNSSTPSGSGGSLARFTVVGNYLYAVDQQSLKVFDLTDPVHPVFKRSVSVGLEIETIFPFKDKLFIGSTSVVHIFSISDPTNPQKLSEAISPDVMRRCDPVVAKDSVAYATLRTNGACGGTQSILAIFDIKDVAHPVQKGSRPLSEPYGLGYQDNTLYVCDKNNGLMVFDITQAYNPTLVRSVTGVKMIDVIPYGDVLVGWTSDGMVLYDISDRKNPVLLTNIR
jgi:hypothetical protein